MPIRTKAKTAAVHAVPEQAPDPPPVVPGRPAGIRETPQSACIPKGLSGPNLPCRGHVRPDGRHGPATHLVGAATSMRPGSKSALPMENRHGETVCRRIACRTPDGGPEGMGGAVVRENLSLPSKLGQGGDIAVLWV